MSLLPTPDMPGELRASQNTAFKGVIKQSSPGLRTEAVNQSRATSLVPDLVILGEGSLSVQACPHPAGESPVADTPCLP